MNKTIIFVPILLGMLIFAVNSAEKPECPQDVEGEIPVHRNLPHKNCSLFYKCDHGNPVEQECPQGLHFNPNLELCDYPDAAGCTGINGRKVTFKVTIRG